MSPGPIWVVNDPHNLAVLHSVILVTANIVRSAISSACGEGYLVGLQSLALCSCSAQLLLLAQRHPSLAPQARDRRRDPP